MIVKLKYGKRELKNISYEIILEVNMRNEVLKVDNIEKYYGNKSNITKAINNISFRTSIRCIF